MTENHSQHPAEDTAATNERETLAEVLARHRFVPTRDQDGTLDYGWCGGGDAYATKHISEHEAHVAEMLAATQRPDDREATLRVLALCDEADEAAAADVTEYESRHPGNFASALVTTTSVRAALAAADGEATT